VFIKKSIELNTEDLLNILANVQFKELNNELFSRDANYIVDHLNESQQLKLLQQLLRHINISPKFEEELKFQLRRRNLEAFNTLSLSEIMNQLFKDYHLYEIFDVLSHLLRDQNS
jgi:hypothetical protein